MRCLLTCMLRLRLVNACPVLLRRRQSPRLRLRPSSRHPCCGEMSQRCAAAPGNAAKVALLLAPSTHVRMEQCDHLESSAWSLQPAAKQAAPVAMKSKPGKRKGPLPLWLAEIIVILGIGGVLFATAKW